MQSNKLYLNIMTNWINARKLINILDIDQLNFESLQNVKKNEKFIKSCKLLKVDYFYKREFFES